MKNQLKYFIAICVIIYGLNIHAQGNTCATATEAVLGVNTIDGPISGEGAEGMCVVGLTPVGAAWFTYTAATSVLVTVSSCLGGEDTRVSVFDGSCASLNCVGSNDDSCPISPGGFNKASFFNFNASAGTTYYIQWDNRFSTNGFDWTISQVDLDCQVLALNIGEPCDFLATDDGIVDNACNCIIEDGSTCSTALAAVEGLNIANGPFAGVGAENVCAFEVSGTSADWFTYTPVSATSITVSSCLGEADTRVSIFEGSCGALTCVASNDNFCISSSSGELWASSVTFVAAAGITYYIQWDNRKSSSGFDWTLTLSGIECPLLGQNIGDVCDAIGTDDGFVNDACACVYQENTCSSATIAVLGVNVANGPQYGGGAQTICNTIENLPAVNAEWFTYTPASNVVLRVASCLGDADTRVSVFDGSCAALNCVAYNDDACSMGPGGPNFASEATFSAIAGTTYYIQFDDRWSTSGFEWTLIDDLNYDCQNLSLNFGDTCDDGDVDTKNDIVEADCTCQGIPYDCPLLGQDIGDDCDFEATDDGVVNNACLCVTAEGSSCETALEAELGINTVEGMIEGGGAANNCGFDSPATDAEWFTYTSVTNTSLTISSCLNGLDTRVSVFEGSCGALSCVAANDDFCEMGPGEALWASSVTFDAIAGATYFIQWDDRWSDQGFDWTISSPPCNCDCPVLGLDIGDPCDGGIVREDCNCVPLSVPSCPTLNYPTQNAPAVEIDPANNNNVYFNWTLNGVQQEDEVSLYIGTSPSELFLQATGPAGATGGNIAGFPTGLFYWTVRTVNEYGESPGCNVNQFTVVEKLDSIPDCPKLVSPFDGSGIILSEDIITWINAITGEPDDLIEIYFGLEPTNLNLVGEVEPNIESFNISGLIEQGLTYYWSVIPSNYLGESEHCEVFSFTVAGTPDCPSLGLNGLNVGSPCDDGNPFTDLEEVYLFADECVCVGIPIPINATCNGGTLVTEGVYPGNQISTGVGAINSCFPNGGTNALWYYYNATSDGYVTVDATIDSDQPDTRLSVYTGSCMDLTCHAFNDDAQGVFSSKVTFPVVDGEIYFIEWDDNWSTTEFDFEVSFDGSAYCSGATPITDGVYNDNFITLGSDGASDLCFGSGFVNDAKWFSYTSYGFGEVTIDATIDPLNPDTRLSIYTGPCDHLTCLTSNDWFDIGNNVRSSKVTFPVVFGETYLIEWDDRWAGTFFDFEVSFDGIVSCATDLDGNGTTNGNDFAIFLGNFGINCNSSFCATDFNNDGMTDGVDFGIFLGNFDLDCPAPN